MSNTTLVLDACQARNDSGSLTPSLTGLVTSPAGPKTRWLCSAPITTAQSPRRWVDHWRRSGSAEIASASPPLVRGEFGSNEAEIGVALDSVTGMAGTLLG